MSKMSGGCLCGRVRYETSAEPVFSGVCHCTDCQKANGSAFNVVVAVPSAGVAMTGTLTEFELAGESGHTVTRRFCPTCGTPIASLTESMPGITLLKVGALDDPAMIAPATHIYCRSKLPWVVIPEGAQVVDGMLQA